MTLIYVKEFIMKKIILALSVLSFGLFASTAQAQDCRYGVDHRHPSCFQRIDYRPYHRGPVIVREGGGWVGPLVGGVVLGAIISEANRPTVIQQPPVVVQQPPVVYQPVPLLRQPPIGFHWQEMDDPVTGERKIVAVPN